MDEVKADNDKEEKTPMFVSWAIVALLAVVAIVLVFLFKTQAKPYEIIAASVLFMLTVFVLAAIQMCHVLTAKSIALSTIQLKIEEEKRKQEEAKKACEDAKYEIARKILKVEIVQKEV